MTSARAGRARPVSIRALAARLQAWYEAGHRDLPWRRTRDPYAIWVSEIMLQQTQVSKVLPYYARFLDRFPGVGALAGAREEDVLKVWEGLGYYRRARNLMAAAKRLAASGGWPRDASALTLLPGVGRSTAGAIASIAFGARAPILDGNVRRVWSRVAALGGPPGGERLHALWAMSEEAVRAGDPAAVNQALMELGATVCTPRAPRCGGCPIAGGCLAFRRGEPEAYPAKRPRRAKPSYDVSVAILWKGERFLVSRRPADAMLGGLWELPGGKWEEGEDGESALRRELEEELGVPVEILRSHDPVRHTYSHFSVRLHPFSCRLPPGPKPSSAQPLRWIAPRDIPSLAFPTGTLKVFERVLTGELERAAEQPPSYGT